MVPAGVQLFFVVFSFSVVICSITSYCLRAKQVLSHQPVAMRGPLWWTVHVLAKMFFPMGVSTDVVVFRSRGGSSQCSGDF